MRPADNKTPCRVDIIFGFIIQQILRNGVADHLFHHILRNLLLRHVRVMLGRNDNRIHSRRHAVYVFYRHLALAVRAQIRQLPAFARFCQAARQRMGQFNG